MNIEIKKLAHHDIDQFIELIRLFEDVFEMKDFQLPAQSHLQQVLEKKSFFVFVALQEGKVVGGLTAHVLEQYYSQMPVAYIYDLAVKTTLQRKGIGKKLIAAINQYCKETGIQEVFVQADNVDLHALAFYRSTGGMAEEVTHFTYPLNVGMDIS